MSLNNDLEPRNFAIFVNSVLRLYIFKEDGIASEDIYALFDASEWKDNKESINTFIKEIKLFLSRAASEDWSQSQMQTIIKDMGLTDDQCEVFNKLWKSNKDRIHDLMIQQSRWSGTLSKFQWRLDVKMNSKDEASSTGEPLAIAEIITKQPLDQSNKTLRFEMDRNQISTIVDELSKIEEVIKKY